MSLQLSLMYVAIPLYFNPRCSSYVLVDKIMQNLAAETAAYLTTKHPDYAILAARIAVSNLHKETKKNFSHVVKDLYDYGSCPFIEFLTISDGPHSQPEDRTIREHDLKGDV